MLPPEPAPRKPLPRWLEPVLLVLFVLMTAKELWQGNWFWAGIFAVGIVVAAVGVWGKKNRDA
jgi:hypothetical protein